MDYQTKNISVELVNTGFCDKVVNGHIKEAQEAGSQYIRTQLYENGILRRIFDSQLTTPDLFDPELDTDNPRILCEIEPDAPRATFVPYKGTGDRSYFKGKRFYVPFGKVESDRISKSIFELETIRMPITDWLKEHQVKAVQHEEDKLFVETLDAIVNDNSDKQLVTVDMSTNTFKDVFTEGWKAMTRLRLPEGKALMHHNTFLDSLKLKTDDIGFRPQESRFDRGLSGETSFMGTEVVTTIKDDIVPENVIYFFTQQPYFIKFYLQRDATLYMESKADMIEFHTYESVGVGIGNTNGVVKVVLA